MQSSEAEFTHQTVLRDEVSRLAATGVGDIVIDATLGLGGHSEAILESTELRVIGIDQDAKAIEMATTRLARFGERFQAVNANFESIADVANDADGAIAAIIADLGVSSMQLDDASRGFSFRFDAPLDMRMDTSRGDTAADLLADLDEVKLANVIYEFGEERKSRKIAHWIANRNREGNPVRTTADLADLVQRAIGRKPGDKIHPATRTFQALRIAVNREIEILEDFLTTSVAALNDDGVLAVITFHSLEDRIVKHTFQRLAGKCICPPRLPTCICGASKKAAILTKKPILPSDDELRMNPRSRSAKLRACKRAHQ